MDSQSLQVDQNMLKNPQKLYMYLKIIRDIDIEKSMESIVELMNMLKLIFPIRFARIKQKMFNMYDPITNQNFGVAFQTLLNILRDKSKRDKLHTIFQEKLLPKSLEVTLGSPPAAVEQPAIKIPLKLKSDHTLTAAKLSSAKDHQGTEGAYPAGGKFRYPLPPAGMPEQQEPNLDTSVKIERTAKESKPLKEPDQSLRSSLQSKIQTYKNSVELSGARRRDAELKQERLRNVLDRVRSSKKASQDLQEKAARMSQTLAKEGVAAPPMADGRPRISRKISIKIE